MRMLKSWLILVACMAGTAVPAEVKAPALLLHGFLESLEIAPVLLAADRQYPRGIMTVTEGRYRIDGRQPRDRQALAKLIDYSLLDEVTAERASAKMP
jgi:hypothetical protein